MDHDGDGISSSLEGEGRGKGVGKGGKRGTKVLPVFVFALSGVEEMGGGGKKRRGGEGGGLGFGEEGEMYESLGECVLAVQTAADKVVLVFLFFFFFHG